ncbi:MAG: DUF4167 domain-containing protein [Lactobacillaceae bacterium]|jgi:hypothetical protein|nr:DUF4167 domain-containing protein [Lactobacillaceae bacterium]
MKKINNKFRSNGNGNSHNNQIYSLNYKFDSNSIAGKFSGTALELIKKYNELARDANNNNDIVNAEIFRQYAEHYRKIVTDINDKKSFRTPDNRREDTAVSEEKNSNEQAVDNENHNEAEVQKTAPEEETAEKKKPVSLRKKEFKVVEVKEAKKEDKEEEKKPAALRIKRTKKDAEEAVAAI